MPSWLGFDTSTWLWHKWAALSSCSSTVNGNHTAQVCTSVAQARHAAGAAPPMLAPSMLGPAPVMPLPAFPPRLMTSSPAQLPFGFGTMPMIPNPELGLACGEGGGPPSAQRVIAEFLAQPNQVGVCPAYVSSWRGSLLLRPSPHPSMCIPRSRVEEHLWSRSCCMLGQVESFKPIELGCPQDGQADEVPTISALCRRLLWA